MDTSIDRARILLQRELARRCEHNPRYSLRAFARALGISHPLLSLILSGKRKLSKKSARKIVDRLPLELNERKFFLDDFDFAEESRSESTQIDIDTFSLISDWKHYAILSLMDIRGAKFDGSWIAKRLNISVHEAKASMELLQRMNLIKRRGRAWRQTGFPIRIENKTSTAATRNFHKGLLARALNSLELDPMEVRDFSSMTFTMDPELIPFALQKIRKFRRYLTAELEKMKPGKRVYNLTIQLFPISDGDSISEETSNE